MSLARVSTRIAERRRHDILKFGQKAIRPFDVEICSHALLIQTSCDLIQVGPYPADRELQLLSNLIIRHDETPIHVREHRFAGERRFPFAVLTRLLRESLRFEAICLRAGVSNSLSRNDGPLRTIFRGGN